MTESTTPGRMPIDVGVAKGGSLHQGFNHGRYVSRMLLAMMISFRVRGDGDAALSTPSPSLYRKVGRRARSDCNDRPGMTTREQRRLYRLDLCRDTRYNGAEAMGEMIPEWGRYGAHSL